MRQIETEWHVPLNPAEVKATRTQCWPSRDNPPPSWHRYKDIDPPPHTHTHTPPPAAISLWLTQLSPSANKAPCPPPPSTPGVDGRKDDPNVDALSFNIDSIGPPASGLNANESARLFLTAAVRRGTGSFITFLQCWMWDSLWDKWALRTVSHSATKSLRWLAVK